MPPFGTFGAASSGPNYGLSNSLSRCALAPATNSTADTIRAALRAIGLAAGTKLASSFFRMIVPPREDTVFGHQGAMLFADGGVVPDPPAEELADIALTTAENARVFL